MKDGPQDAKPTPNGHVIIDDLPHDIADEYIIDELVCEKIGGKWAIIAAVDAARRGDCQEACRILMMARQNAGENERILGEWERYMEVDDGV